MKKKVLIRFAALLSALSILTSCSSSSPDDIGSSNISDGGTTGIPDDREVINPDSAENNEWNITKRYDDCRDITPVSEYEYTILPEDIIKRDGVNVDDFCGSLVGDTGYQYSMHLDESSPRFSLDISALPLDTSDVANCLMFKDDNIAILAGRLNWSGDDTGNSATLWLSVASNRDIPAIASQSDYDVAKDKYMTRINWNVKVNGMVVNAYSNDGNCAYWFPHYTTGKDMTSSVPVGIPSLAINGSDDIVVEISGTYTSEVKDDTTREYVSDGITYTIDPFVVTIKPEYTEVIDQFALSESDDYVTQVSNGHSGVEPTELSVSIEDAFVFDNHLMFVIKEDWGEYYTISGRENDEFFQKSLSISQIRSDSEYTDTYGCSDDASNDLQRTLKSDDRDCIALLNYFAYKDFVVSTTQNHALTSIFGSSFFVGVENGKALTADTITPAYMGKDGAIYSILSTNLKFRPISSFNDMYVLLNNTKLKVPELITVPEVYTLAE